MVGHLTREYSRIAWYFLTRGGGSVSVEASSHHRRCKTTLWRNGDSQLSDIYLFKKGNVKPVKSSFKSGNLCKFTAWCPDVLTDKLHPRFDTKILSKKVRLIRRCLRYPNKDYCGLKKSPQPSLHAISRFWMFISSAKIDR